MTDQGAIDDADGACGHQHSPKVQASNYNTSKEHCRKHILYHNFKTHLE